MTAKGNTGTSKADAPWDMLSKLLDKADNAGIHKWIKDNATPPAGLTRYSYTQNPGFGSFSLWYTALASPQKLTVIDQLSDYFRVNFPKAYWFNRDDVEKETFGLIDGLMEEGRDTPAHNFMAGNLLGLKKISNPKTVAKILHQGSIEHEKGGWPFLAQAVLFSIPEKAFQETSLGGVKQLFSFYFDKFGQKMLPTSPVLWAVKEDDFIGRLGVLMEHEILTPEQTLYLLCQKPTTSESAADLYKLLGARIKVRAGRTEQKNEKETKGWAQKFAAYLKKLVQLPNKPAFHYLHLAAINNNKQGVEMLLETGICSAQTVNQYGQNLFHVFCENTGDMKTFGLAIKIEPDFLKKLLQMTQNHEVNVLEQVDGRGLLSGILSHPEMKDDQKIEALQIIAGHTRPGDFEVAMRQAVKYILRYN